jgi:hypothetical protein
MDVEAEVTVYGVEGRIGRLDWNIWAGKEGGKIGELQPEYW